MSSISAKPIRTIVHYILMSLLVVPLTAFAQNPGDTAPPDAPPQADTAPPAPPQQEQPAPAPTPGWRRFSPPPATNQQNPPVPSQLTLDPGTFVTVRVDQFLSSDRNQAGDTFSATLAQPLVIEGIVVAQRGQTVGGRVTDAEKAGRVKGVSRLALTLTDLSLVDGHVMPIQTTLTNLKGPTSNGRDAAAIAGTTAFGAAVGAAAAWGTGAAIGAGAGLVASTVGVLVTRGRPTVIYPESLLTFRLSAPVVISTDRAPQAFRYLSDYDQGPAGQGPPPESASGQYGYGPPAPPAYYGYYPPYNYPYYPYYWGPSFGFYFGPGYYGRGYYGGRFYGYGRSFYARGGRR